MIRLKDQKINLSGKEYPITTFEVWWRTPFGLQRHISDAIKSCEENDFDPELTLIPVCVAIAPTTYEEFRRI